MAETPTILVAEDDTTQRQAIAELLAEAGYAVTAVPDGRAALSALRPGQTRFVIADSRMPYVDGLELCRQIRANAEHLGFVYVLMLTGAADTPRLMEAYAAGANDFLAKPYDPRELLARVGAGARVLKLESELTLRVAQANRLSAELAVVNGRLERLATTDELTGLLNRRQALAELEHHWAASVRYEQPLACATVDVDHFKHFNDEHGHDAGDRVLQVVASALSGTVRTCDRVCRFGGEEFLAIFPGQYLPEAARAAERCRAAIEAYPLLHRRERLSVTVSIGVAVRRPKMSGPGELLRAADTALYAAKRQGRNRVVSDGAAAMAGA